MKISEFDDTLKYEILEDKNFVLSLIRNKAISLYDLKRKGSSLADDVDVVIAAYTRYLNEEEKKVEEGRKFMDDFITSGKSEEFKENLRRKSAQWKSKTL